MVYTQSIYIASEPIKRRRSFIGTGKAGRFFFRGVRRYQKLHGWFVSNVYFVPEGDGLGVPIEWPFKRGKLPFFGGNITPIGAEAILST